MMPANREANRAEGVDDGRRELVERILSELVAHSPTKPDIYILGNLRQILHDELREVVHQSSLLQEAREALSVSELASLLFAKLAHDVLEWYHGDDDLMPQSLVQQLTVEAERLLDSPAVAASPTHLITNPRRSRETLGNSSDLTSEDSR